jgi:integrase
MANNHWTNTKVEQLHGKSLYSLGNNLYVREKSGGRKYYVFIYRQRTGKRRGKKEEMTYGRTTKLDIKDAQQWAQQQNTLIADGYDPKIQKKVDRQTAEKVARTHMTFAEAMKEYIASKTDPKDPERWGEDCTNQMLRIEERILSFPPVEPNYGAISERIEFPSDRLKLSTSLVSDPDTILHAGGRILNVIKIEAPVMALRFRDLMKGTMAWAKKARCYSSTNPFDPALEDSEITTLAPIRHSSKPHPGWHHREMPRLYKLLFTAETDSANGGLWTTAQAAKATGRERYVILNDITSNPPRIPAVGRANVGKTSTYLVKPTDVAKRYEIKNPNAEPNFGVEHLALPLIRFLLLTAVRFSEANEMSFDEINWTARTWTIPAKRLTPAERRKPLRPGKTAIEHVVPLSPPAYDILKHRLAQKHKNNPLVFVHGPPLTGSDYHIGDPLTDACVRRHLRKATGDPFITIHSFRRNCRSFAKERGYSLEVRRMILGHATGNEVDGTYEGDAQCPEICRELLEAWAKYLGALPTSPNIRSLDEKRRASNA